jgi:ribosomal protein S18 acetylase RimI-like enzyme
MLEAQPEGYTIRAATMADLGDLLALRIDMLREVGNAGDPSAVPHLLDANRRYFESKLPTGEFLAWVAEAEGRIVAISGLIPFVRPPTANNLAGLEGHILNMYTVPECRGKGIATRLLDEIIGTMRARGARRLWLKATPAGRPIYERAGFVVIGSSARSPGRVEMELVW